MDLSLDTALRRMAVRFPECYTSCRECGAEDGSWPRSFKAYTICAADKEGKALGHWAEPAKQDIRQNPPWRRNVTTPGGMIV